MKARNRGRNPRQLLRQENFCAEPIQRTNFFPGRLLTAEDLIAEQEYHREKQRQHNLHCHGCGVIGGLNVSIEKTGSQASVVVGPGVAIDAEGNQIHICAATKVLLPKATSALHVSIRFVERFAGSIPVARTVDEPDMMPERVEEGCEVILVKAVGLSKALSLARLIFRSGNWRLDRSLGISENVIIASYKRAHA